MNYHLLAVGQTLTLPRYVNASAGYTSSFFTTSNLNVVKERWNTPSSDVVGAGSDGIITIEAISPGTGYCGQWNYRSWEREDVRFTPITIEVVEPHELIEINLYIINNKVVGYSEINTDTFHPAEPDTLEDQKFKRSISSSKITSYSSDSRRTSRPKKYDEVIPVKIKYSSGKIEFYRLNGELLYHQVPEQHISDFMFCVSNTKGRNVGCPSGGIAGHGDGKIPNFSQAVLLGKIVIYR